MLYEVITPDKFTHTVLSKRSTFPESEDNDVMGYINASFYKPINGIHISPLAHNAFAYYKYRYEGYFEEGDNMIYKIKIIPKRKSKQVYSGYIYIVDGLCVITSYSIHYTKLYELKVGCNSSFGWIRNLKIKLKIRTKE